jgi:hypothetical protein
MPRLPESARLIGSYTAPALDVGDREDCLCRGVLCRFGQPKRLKKYALSSGDAPGANPFLPPL